MRYAIYINFIFIQCIQYEVKFGTSQVRTNISRNNDKMTIPVENATSLNAFVIVYVCAQRFADNMTRIK